jgi:hypothetical protein
LWSPWWMPSSVPAKIAMWKVPSGTSSHGTPLRGRSRLPTNPAKRGTRMTNNPTSNSSVDYQQVKRGLPATHALTTSNSSVTLPATQAWGLPAGEAWLTLELPLYVVINKSLNLSRSLVHVVSARSCSRRPALVAWRCHATSRGSLSRSRAVQVKDSGGSR